MAGLFLQHLKAFPSLGKFFCLSFVCLLIYSWSKFLNGAIPTFRLSQNPDPFMNSTLGFEKVYALALPGRGDRTKPLLDAAKASNMTFTVLDAVRDAEIEKTFWPKDWKKSDHVIGELGCLVSHVRTWNRQDCLPTLGYALTDDLIRMIYQDISTALIIESDADWDLRIRSIMRQLADGVKALIDWPFHQPHHTQPSHIQPYGDTWDILWTGHCGSSHDGNTRIYSWNDSTVPPKDKTWKYKPTLTDEQHVYGTRSVFQFGRATCTTSYAVTLQGAAKLVNYFKTTNEGFDETLSRLCTTKEDMVCLAVWPQVHLASITASNIDHDGDKKVTAEGELEHKPIIVQAGPSIQYSAWRNARRIIDEGVGWEEWVPEWNGTWVVANGSRVFDDTERAILEEE